MKALGIHATYLVDDDAEQEARGQERKRRGIQHADFGGQKTGAPDRDEVLLEPRERGRIERGRRARADRADHGAEQEAQEHRDRDGTQELARDQGVASWEFLKRRLKELG